MAPAWFVKLDANLRVLASKMSPEHEKKVAEYLDLAKEESHGQAKPEPPRPSFAVTSIPPSKVIDTFNLKWGVGGWGLLEEHRKPMLPCVRNALDDFALATNHAPEKEALVRSRIDAILYMTLADKKRGEHSEASRRSSLEPLTQYRSVDFQAETDIKIPWTYDSRKVTLSGKADYSLWYGNAERPESNLVVVEAKTQGNDGLMQVISYMAIIHHARKRAHREDTTIWGIATNSWEWKFVCLEADSTVNYVSYSFNLSEGASIIGMLHKIFDHAARLGPALSRTSSLSRKRTLEEAAGLEVSSR